MNYDKLYKIRNDIVNKIDSDPPSISSLKKSILESLERHALSYFLDVRLENIGLINVYLKLETYDFNKQIEN